MKLYSDLPVRRVAQILGDLALLGWCSGAVLAGRAVHDVTLALAAPGRALADAGGSFRSSMTEAATSARDVPLLPDALGAPFTKAADVGGQLESSGNGLVHGVEQLALALGLVTATLPIVLAVLTWLALRGRFIRKASAAQRFIDSAADLDLFALRALARQPLPRLAALSDDPAGDWRRRDPRLVRALAELELRDAGLRPPERPLLPDPAS